MLEAWVSTYVKQAYSKNTKFTLANSVYIMMSNLIVLDIFVRRIMYQKQFEFAFKYF